MTVTADQILTADDLLTMPADARFELIAGELFEMPPPGYAHGSIISEIAFILGRHVRANKLGRVLGAETGFRLARNPDTVRGIDVAFVSTARLPTVDLEKHYDGAPDLSIEVISPGDTVSAIEDKVDQLLQAGSRAVWVINPKRKTLTVHTADAHPRVLRAADTIDAGDIVPGFACVVEEFFA